ncbi:MAG: J domain-containing protein [Clostridia bacterium]|nr:J domain-containing protein [Clostridia bacterium]
MILLNHYEVLSVKPTASQSEIKKAYRALAKKYHPDTYKGDKSFAEERMQEINRAYDVLSNVELRKSYDVAEGIKAEESVEHHRKESRSETESNPYKTYNDMMRNVKYHQNRTGTYYDRNGYARANYTPYNEEGYFEEKKKSKFISFEELVSSKKWIMVALVILIGAIAVGVFLSLFMQSLNDTIGDFKTFDDFFRYFN